jgi:hypothetical protein
MATKICGSGDETQASKCYKKCLRDARDRCRHLSAAVGDEVEEEIGKGGGGGGGGGGGAGEGVGGRQLAVTVIPKPALNQAAAAAADTGG